MDAKISITARPWQNAINSLLLNASFIDNIGLLHGKMGISICFYHLARQTGNQIYEDYAGELIDEIYEEITANTPVDFENGLAGIGYGIEYLVQNGFIEADTDEVLEEFDNRIFKELIYNTPRDIGLLNGLVGIGAYFLKRIKDKASSDENIPTLTNKQALIHLIDELDLNTQNIPEIFSEPFSERSPSDKPSNNRRTFEQFSNPQTLKPSNPRTPEHSILFDLTWDYPVLLWFLSELYKQNIFNFKVEKIIQRLTKPLAEKNNLPTLQSNRLLLALALTRLQQTTKPVSPGIHEQSEMNITGRTNPESAANRDNPAEIYSPIVEFRGVNKRQTSNDNSQSNSQTIVDQQSNLLAEINRNTINSELPPHNVTLRYGTSGIAWIYQQLHRLAGGSHFKEEMEYWLTQRITEKKEDNLSGTGIDNKNVCGILEGFAGVLLIAEILK